MELGAARPRPARPAPALALPDGVRAHRRGDLDDRGHRPGLRALAAAGPPAGARRAGAARGSSRRRCGSRGDVALPRLRSRGRQPARLARSRRRTGTSPGSASSPDEQRRGIGGALLAPGVEAAERAGLPCALLTNSEQNLSFYRAHGFEVVLEDETPSDGPHAWMMVSRHTSSALRAVACLPGRTNLGDGGRGRAKPGLAAAVSRLARMTAKRFPDRDEIAAVRAEAEALEPGEEGPEERRLAGRVLARREMGKLVFLDLVDRSGRIQLLCPANRTGSGRRPPRRHRRRDRPPDQVAARRAVARRRPARAARAHPLAAARHLPRPDRRRAALPPPLPRPADERGDARRLHAARPDGHGDPARARRRRVRRGRDAGPPAALRRRVRAAVLDALTTSSIRRSTCGSRPSCTSSGSSSAGSSACTSSARTSATRASPSSTTPSSRCSSGTRPTPTTATRWRAWSGSSRVSPRRPSARRPSPSAATRSISEAGAASSWSTRSPSTTSGRATPTSCGHASRSASVDTQHDRTWAQLVDHALSHFVEPGLIQPTILYDYPVELSPFARMSDEDGIVERFEYFVGGMELGNAFTEINDSRGAGGALRDAGGRGRGRQRRGRAGRPGLRRGALLRHAADRRARDGDRPARDGAARARTRSAT